MIVEREIEVLSYVYTVQYHPSLVYHQRRFLLLLLMVDELDEIHCIEKRRIIDIYLPRLSGFEGRNFTCGTSPFGSAAGSTRVPMVGFPVRADTGGAGDEGFPAECCASFCSSLLKDNNPP